MENNQEWKSVSYKKQPSKKPSKNITVVIQKWSDDKIKEHISNPCYKFLDQIEWSLLMKHFDLDSTNPGNSKFKANFDGKTDRSALNDIYFNLFRKTYGFYYKKWHHSVLSDSKRQMILYRKSFDDMYLATFPFNAPYIGTLNDLFDFLAEHLKTNIKDCTMKDFKEFLLENDTSLYAKYCEEIPSLEGIITDSAWDN